MAYNIEKTDNEWKKELSEEEYRILRKKGTERPFTGEYNDHFKEGIYSCTGCGSELFRSDSKFESGCGWPSFGTPLAKENIELKEDISFGMNRVEVLCKNCGGHLGHVFNDGPTPTGLRYCINSVSLKFADNSKRE